MRSAPGGAGAAASAAKSSGGCTSGRTSRPDCSDASVASRRQRASRCRPSARIIERSVQIGWIAATPSSVAFSTMKSKRCGRSSAGQSVICGGAGGRTARLSSIWPSTASRVTRVTRTV